MLRHSETSSADTTPYRLSTTESRALGDEESKGAAFTAEEIANAIAEIETEKALRRSTQSRATQIVSVLEHLNLAMSASEVEAKIVQQCHTRNQARIGRSSSHRILAAVATVLFCTTIGIGGWLLGARQALTPVQEAATVAVAVPAQKVALAPEEATAVSAASTRKIAMTAAENADYQEHLARQAVRQAEIAAEEALAARGRADQEEREQAVRSRHSL